MIEQSASIKLAAILDAVTDELEYAPTLRKQKNNRVKK